jgi:class 3 adenylate cyclase
MKETDLLESFLPLKLLTRVHHAGGDRPAAVTFPAAVLFVDVSRYTALVEQLARRGQGGLEKISRLLSLSYGRCADQICDRGGEVLYFEGDSLVAYWVADGDDLGNAVRAAAACAEAICSDIGDASTSGTDPALHVGVGAGALWAAALGGKPVWNLVAGGDALIQAATSQALARPREYVLSDAAAQALAQARVRSSGNVPEKHPELPSTRPPLDWLTSFLPLQLHEALRGQNSTAGPRDLESYEIENLLGAIQEIRPVSAVFARISGLDLRTPIALTRLQALCVSLQENLRARGGPPGELYYDEKGLIFSGVFGSRGNFHRDDPFRAIDTARAMDQTIKGLELSASIGVATGHALFCVVGSARRRQLMVHGASVNRAARLMTALASGVICDAPTERANRTTFDFERQGTLQLDGLGDMAAVFRPLEPRPTVAGPSTLIGRESELAVLKQTFEETRNGGTRLLAVLGEPGIGKTALVTAFTDELQGMGTPVAIARAEREDRRTSFLAWRRVLASLLDLPPDCNGFTTLEAVRTRVQGMSDVVTRLPLLGGVLGIAIPENEGTRHLEGPHRGDATMRLLGDLVGVLAPRPLVLVLEDSQWLDSASWRLIEWILASLSSLLLIVCVRLEEIPEELKSLRRRAEAARLNTSRREADDPARFCQILDLEEHPSAK